ncbi:MAG: nitroreductase family protein [Thermoleophilia bacterium]|nr:nitroreductase family protein [Thermoleophilia bacterium]
MDVFEAIRTRRSRRAFDSRPVEPDKINKILDAACWAPSPSNSQPWEFVVITNEASRNRLYDLSEIAREKGTVELHGYAYVRPTPIASVDEESEEREKSFPDYAFTFLRKVPVIVAVVGLPQAQVRLRGAGRIQDGYKYACAAAIQNMLLAAQALELGSLWFTFFDQKLVGQFLNIDPGKHIVALVCLGYPAGDARSPGRYPCESKVRRLD